jgi:hypothetical protein
MSVILDFGAEQFAQPAAGSVQTHGHCRESAAQNARCVASAQALPRDERQHLAITIAELV